ncbi:MAG: response regulator [Desulfarculaceae bacterium]|nr:response regulator [Desulfarculaceae bacterium]MCF8070885.1 response regulator [Desulfarculaceae bacterium]MCF8100473.1 response regulator [Desulfarculaceae bacterium]MCF8118212.1 response regulator [Desulfarculaceae bacterium]
MQNSRVLIVDDEPEILQALGDLYTAHGAEVLTSDDSRRALDMARHELPDLVLLDVMMPGLTGYDICRELKQHDATRRIPVIMVTGLGDLDHKIQGLDVGADDFLTKPVNSSELMTRSRALLRVKELGDELEGAYRSMADIASYTNALLRRFDPRGFDPQQSLGGLMEFLLGPGTNTTNRAERVILLSKGQDGAWEAWRYQRSEQIILNQQLGSSLPDEAVEPMFQGQASIFCNRDDECHRRVAGAGLWERLNEPPPRDNMVAYQSGSVAVLAIDCNKAVSDYEAQVLSAMVATIHVFMKTISGQMREVERAFFYTIESLARAAESHDEDTANHIVRVKRYAEALGRALGREETWVTELGYAAQMHDVGKLHVHPDVLRKPGPLTQGEWEEVKKHTLYGARILGDHPRLAMAREVALNHHEHWDGSGYPQGLAGEEIPLSGRISMMADVYDALRSTRHYKLPYSHEESVKVIREGDHRLRPHWFDPRVLEAFLDIHVEFAKIYRESKD